MLIQINICASKKLTFNEERVYSMHTQHQTNRPNCRMGTNGIGEVKSKGDIVRKSNGNE